MTYSIFDGPDLVRSFDCEDEAREALVRLAAAGVEVRDALLLVAFDDAGNVIADCAVGEATRSDSK
jgi:hypothetical protein